jgi:hypothetical protein
MIIPPSIATLFGFALLVFVAVLALLNWRER